MRVLLFIVSYVSCFFFKLKVYSTRNPHNPNSICRDKKHVNVTKVLSNAEIFNVAVWSMKCFDSRVTYPLMNGNMQFLLFLKN
jgi:hypothetical protein